ncbi:MarR family transcriptional regulator [Staphylococcus sp. ACRSN]|uniref:transcriptional regulator, SarA/Rot family n=1 Tax=Staphylococcus TaxID=1279 RepID=UPI0011C79B5C|nr:MULTISPECIES: MarR family transcriptional regulator [Staphylococcus]MCG7340166.1 MarR family transcriptional regulator [Staphylococcus sp. ACRSN]MEB6279110.1 MarR family transcriptional regulator [Staphylococcus gallinarum]
MNVDSFVKANLNIQRLNRYLHQSLDITQNHIAILSLVLNSQNQSMELQTLNHILQIDNSVLTRQLQLLEKRGYLKRKRHKGDMRKVSVFMSEQQMEETLALMDLINEYIKDYEV